MPYSDQTEYPRGVFQAALDVIRTVTTGPIRVSSIVYAGESINGNLTIENGAGTRTIARLKVPPATLGTREIEGFYSPDGLRFNAPLGGSSFITVFYFTA